MTNLASDIQMGFISNMYRFDNIDFHALRYVSFDINHLNIAFLISEVNLYAATLEHCGQVIHSSVCME